MSTIARLTLGEYDRMIEHGVFDRQRRLEFIRGEIREMNPIGPEHEDILDLLTSWSFEHLPKGRVRVRIQESIGLPGLESAPQPDLVWAVQGDYRRRRPAAGEVLLLVEVADSSLEYDAGEKAALYAEAGIADYWVVNIPDRSIEVRRDPEGNRYRTLQAFAGDEEARPLAFPELVLRPSMLFPA